ncbi:hypothetical protein RB653_005025 [Dictyostelium firmibasis]|uniref:Uncharacterized protein n=1 Tax=Dictyostelium firmibasis TaxID=79012 RepID=A0AAN7Z0N1_9MYCE
MDKLLTTSKDGSPINNKSCGSVEGDGDNALNKEVSIEKNKSDNENNNDNNDNNSKNDNNDNNSKNDNNYYSNNNNNNFAKGNIKKLKIRIVNKETDYKDEYSFQEFIKFSNELIEERGHTIRNTPSVTDFQNPQIVMVSVNSPIPTPRTITTTTTTTIPNDNNNNNNNNINSDDINNDGLLGTSMSSFLPTSPLVDDSIGLKSPLINPTANQLKSLTSGGSFYLNTNPDFTNSTNSLLEFSNHQRSNSSLVSRRVKNSSGGIGGSGGVGDKNQQTTIGEGDGDDYDDIVRNKKKNKDEKVYWIDLEGLSDEEISMVCNLYSIHHLTFEDITSEDSTEKCEEFSNYTFISTSETIYSYTDLVQSNIYMVQFSNFVLIFHEHPLDSIEDVFNAFRYLESGIIATSQWIVSTFFESFNEIYSELSDQLMKEVNVLDEFTLSEDAAHHSELYVRLGKATRKSTNLLSWIFIKNDMLSSLIRLTINKEDRIHLSNIKDRTVRLKQKIKMAEELLENISNIYISKVSLVLNEESHALNISMGKFSSLSVIFMPLNLIAAIFGMNVRLPGEADPDSTGESSFSAFISLMMIMVAIGSILTLFFKKLDWL